MHANHKCHNNIKLPNNLASAYHQFHQTANTPNTSLRTEACYHSCYKCDNDCRNRDCKRHPMHRAPAPTLHIYVFYLSGTHDNQHYHAAKQPPKATTLHTIQQILLRINVLHALIHTKARQRPEPPLCIQKVFKSPPHRSLQYHYNVKRHCSCSNYNTPLLTALLFFSWCRSSSGACIRCGFTRVNEQICNEWHAQCTLNEVLASKQSGAANSMLHNCYH